jgi:large repetitive protein
MGHTSKTEFASVTDWIDVSTLTQVYSSEFTSSTSSGWISIDITDWAYNGTDNIVVAVDENKVGFNSAEDDFYTSQVADNRGICYCNESFNPDPASSPEAIIVTAYIANIVFGGITTTCPRPIGLTASGVGSSTADLIWNAVSGASGYNWEVVLSGSGQGNSVISSGNTSNTCAQATGLAPGANYDAYVQNDCGGNYDWPVSFTTDCNTTFPWLEGFEGIFMPPCWTKIVTSGNDITHSDEIVHNGGFSARFNSYSSSSNYNQYLFSPEVTIEAGYNQLSFWHKKHDSNPELLEWGVGTTTNPNDYTWTSVTLSNTTLQESTVDLSAYIGQTVYIAWHYYGNFLYYVYLDDVKIDVPILCLTPTNQVVTSNTTTGVDMGWTDATGTHWDLYIVPHGNPASEVGSTSTVNDLSNVTYTWTGGDAGSYYDWYVRSDCGQDNSNVSAWIGPNTYNTICNSTNVPYFENFDNSSVPYFPACMVVENTNGDANMWITNSDIYFSEPNSASIE